MIMNFVKKAEKMVEHGKSLKESLPCPDEKGVEFVRLMGLGRSKLANSTKINACIKSVEAVLADVPEGASNESVDAAVKNLRGTKQTMEALVSTYALVSLLSTLPKTREPVKTLDDMAQVMTHIGTHCLPVEAAILKKALLLSLKRVVLKGGWASFNRPLSRRNCYYQAKGRKSSREGPEG